MLTEFIYKNRGLGACSSDYATLVLSNGDEIAHCGIINYAYNNAVHLCSFAVHPDFQRRGFAQRLLQHILKQVREDGKNTATLDVFCDNEPAIRVYTKLGFEFESTRYAKIHRMRCYL